MPLLPLCCTENEAERKKKETKHIRAFNVTKT